MAKKNPYVTAAITFAILGVTGLAVWVGYKIITKKGSKTPDPDIDKSLVDKGLNATDRLANVSPEMCRNCDLQATFPLQMGSRGQEVAIVQWVYNVSFPHKKIAVDGDWGNRTEDAFRRFVTSKGFPTAQKLVISRTMYNKYFGRYWPPKS